MVCHPRLTFAGDVTVSVSSPADIAGGVTVGVVLSVFAEMASSADLAEVSSSADLAEVASSADLADVASSANLAGDVTVGVTSLAAYVTFQEECEVPSGYDDYFYDGH